MYTNFFGVQKPPFNLTPDPEFLYLTDQHREALAGLSYAILSRKGFVVLTGTAGTGKTTLVTRILQQLPVSKVQYSVILNPTLTPSEFMEAALLDFGLTDIPSSKAQRIAALQNFLWTARQAGQISALIVDEAHKLSPEVLEEIRLLGNFESASEKLLQVALVGQDELDELLNSERLWQFKQRIARRMTIHPLPLEAVGRYLQFRWTVAGGRAAPFSAEAVAGIAHAAKGIPRLINVICDNALIDAFGDQAAMVELRHVTAVCRDLQLSVPAPVVVPPVVSAPVALRPAAVAPLVIAPVPEIDDFPLTLGRYSTAAVERHSFLGRLRKRFSTTTRIETA